MHTDLNQLIKPNWQRNSTYKRFNKDVIEMPVDSSSQFNFGLKNTSKNYNKAYSRTYFLLLKKDSKYAAYIMVVIADSAYVNGNLSKLSHNTYRRHDADFSGVVLYFTPQGDFLISYGYKNGNVILPKATGTQQLQNVNTKLKTQGNEDAAGCIDWYLVTYDTVTGVVVAEQFLYEDCPGNGNTEGDGGSGPSQNPCVTTSSVNLIINDDPQSPTGIITDTSDGGFPPPPTTTVLVNCADITNNVKDPCLHTMVDSVLSKNIKGNVDALIQGVFGQSVNLDLTFTDQVALSTTTRDAEEQAVLNSNNQFIGADIRLKGSTLSTSSKEYIAATIMHEALHAYMDSKGINLDQHEIMAKNYLNTMASDLKSMFPGMTDLVAYSLAWGGLEGTYLYNNPGTLDCPGYQPEINTLYRAHTDGNGHTFGHGCN